MAFEIKVYTSGASAMDPCGRNRITAEYSDILSIVPEYLLGAIVDKIADKFVEEHYSEIEENLDPVFIAALVSAQMGIKVEGELMKEIERVQNLASQALSRAKKR